VSSQKEFSCLFPDKCRTQPSKYIEFIDFKVKNQEEIGKKIATF